MSDDINISTSDATALSIETCKVVKGCGYLEFDGDIKIIDRFSGNIVVNGHLYVEKDAMVSGAIVSDYLHLHGACSGKATIKTKGVFHDNSKFAGILIANNTEFAEGFVFSGDQLSYQSIEAHDAETNGSKKKLGKEDNKGSKDTNSFNRLFN